MVETLIDWLIMLPVLAVFLGILFGLWKGIAWLGGEKLQQFRKDYRFGFPVLVLLILVFTPFLIVALITGEWKATRKYAVVTFFSMVSLLLLLRRAA
ncbi:MAG: hypothetical protein HOB20_10775 [Planctomycetaceae bacterium]|jgi:hypothetical protein|nr:hypothetical protein [Planctomycetaceae bacterium]